LSRTEQLAHPLLLQSQTTQVDKWTYSVAKDREWFTEYTPFETNLRDIYGLGINVPVLGIGTVILPVERTPGATGEDATTVLHLTTVLHAPSCICNALGQPIGSDYNVIIGGRYDDDVSGELLDQNDRRVLL
jgi:hypothetical protein